MSFEYELENYRGMPIPNTCPECGRNTFQRYVAKSTDTPQSNDFGKCNVETGCGYHRQPDPPCDSHAFISVDIFTKSLSDYKNNTLFCYLSKRHGVDKATQAADEYFMGSSKAYPGATVFWYINREGKIYTGRIVLFNPNTGEGKCKGWVHQRLSNNVQFNGTTSALCKIRTQYEDETYFRSLSFGEHRLKDTTKQVVIVENEKVAIESSCLFPEHLWLSFASGGRYGHIEGQGKFLNRKFIFKPETWKESTNYLL